MADSSGASLLESYSPTLTPDMANRPQKQRKSDDMDEHPDFGTTEERLVRLWAQVKGYRSSVMQSAPLQLAMLVGAGTLSADCVPDALNLWRTYSEQARFGDRPAADYSMILIRRIGDYLAERGQHERHRALLQSTLEAVPSASHKEIVLCRIAHAALREGDPDEALAWLARCDPAPTDLEADSEYRLAVAFVATSVGDFERVLTTVGRGIHTVPLSVAARLMAALLRANALERTDGLLAASGALVEFIQCEVGTPPEQLGLAASEHSYLVLCPQSLPLAIAQLQGQAALVRRPASRESGSAGRELLALPAARPL